MTNLGFAIQRSKWEENQGFVGGLRLQEARRSKSANRREHTTSANFRLVHGNRKKSDKLSSGPLLFDTNPPILRLYKLWDFASWMIQRV